MPLFATQRLFRTADDKIVGEDDPNAAFLLAGVGNEITDADAEKYGLTARSAGVSSTDPNAPKQAEPPADKAAEPVANKGRSRG